MKKNGLVLGLFVIVWSGCASCVLVRSEYFDITGKIHAPKAVDAEIPVYASADVPAAGVAIGSVKVYAPEGTSREKLDEEMRRRARLAGADAITDVRYEEDVSDSVRFCGKVLSTKRSVTAVGNAVIFSGQPQPAQDESRS